MIHINKLGKANHTVGVCTVLALSVGRSGENDGIGTHPADGQSGSSRH